MKAITIFLLFILAAGFVPAQINAQSIVFEDDFESGLSKWTEAYNLFGVWTTKNGMAHIYLPSYFMRYEITPDINWNYQWQNYRISFDYYAISGGDRNINFGFTNQDEWYELHVIGSDYYIVHVLEGNQVWEHRGVKALPLGVLHKFKIELNRGRIVIWINNELLTEVTDPTYSGSFGKPTLKATTGANYPTSINIDNYLIELLEEPITETFEEFKQTDPAWSEDEYDTADSWDDNPTIGRWGCALSSLAMILNFHNISKLPDNTPLDPQSLNNWLKSQADGYIGDGLINWMAGVRLAKQMSPLLNTPKLEYYREDIDPLSAAKTEIIAGRPVVLQIPGHFLAGYSLESDDILIADPAFNYQLFSQHQQDLISTRTFTPSRTDLSFILITHNPELNLQLTSTVTDSSVFNEFLEAAASPQNLSPPTMIHEISKPETGEFLLEVSQADYGSFEIKLYLYNVDAEVRIISYSGFAGPHPEIHSLTYNKYNLVNGNFSAVVSFSGLLARMQEEYESGNISPGAFFYLERYAGFAAQAEINNAEDYYRYVALIKFYFNIYGDQISSDAKYSLDNYLNNLELKLVP